MHVVLHKRQLVWQLVWQLRLCGCGKPLLLHYCCCVQTRAQRARRCAAKRRTGRLAVYARGRNYYWMFCTQLRLQCTHKRGAV